MMKKASKLVIAVLTLFCSLSSTLALFTTTSDFKNVFYTQGYNFKLNATGGIFENTDVVFNKQTLILPVPIKVGYNFLGYSNSLNGDVNYSNNIDNINLINDKSIYAKWGTEIYSISYNLNGGTLNNPKTSYNVEENFTLPIPTKTGYDFVGWTGSGIDSPVYNLVIKNETGNKSYTANWKIKKYIVDVNSTIQNTTYGSGLSGYTFSVWINGVQVADRVIDYYNDSVDYGSNVRVYVYDRTGYNVTSFRDNTWTVTNDLIINPTWYDNIPPTITSFSVTNLGYYNPSVGASQGWNIRVYVNGYDEGTGIQKYQTWLVPYGAGAGAPRVDGNDRTMRKVFYLNQPEGRTFCAYAIDNAGNEAEKCETIRV